MSNCEGIEEALDQADVVRIEGRVETVDRLGQHRVAEAIDHVGELGHDRRVDGDVESVGDQEYVDVGLDLACKLLEHEMLILHLRAELRSLEQAFAVPDESVDLRPAWREGRNVNDEPFVEEGKSSVASTTCLGVLHQPIVLGMEHVVDGGQADVLVDAPVTGDEMRVEQFVVVFGIAVAGIAQADRDVAVGDLADRHRLMRDVGQEGVAGAEAKTVVGLTGARERQDTTCRRVRDSLRRPMPVTTCGIAGRIAE